MENQKFISIREIIAIVIIFGILAAILTPNLLNSRRAANEGSALASLRTLHGAEITYQATDGDGNFGSMTELYKTGLIDSRLAEATNSNTPKSGYFYTLNYTTATTVYPSGFNCEAQPTIHISTSIFTGTGSRRFFVTDKGVLYHNSDNSAIMFDTSSQTISGAIEIID